MLATFRSWSCFQLVCSGALFDCLLPCLSVNVAFSKKGCDLVYLYSVSLYVSFRLSALFICLSSCNSVLSDWCISCYSESKHLQFFLVAMFDSLVLISFMYLLCVCSVFVVG